MAGTAISRMAEEWVREYQDDEDALIACMRLMFHPDRDDDLRTPDGRKRLEEDLFELAGDIADGKA